MDRWRERERERFKCWVRCGAFSFSLSRLLNYRWGQRGGGGFPTPAPPSDSLPQLLCTDPPVCFLISGHETTYSVHARTRVHTTWPLSSLRVTNTCYLLIMVKLFLWGHTAHQQEGSCLSTQRLSHLCLLSDRAVKLSQGATPKAVVIDWAVLLGKWVSFVYKQGNQS